MDKISFRHAQPGDPYYIATHLRPEDRRELQALYGDDVDIFQELVRSMNVSTLRWVGVKGYRPVFVFGVAPCAMLVGSPWLLGVDDSYGRALMQHAGWYIGIMKTVYPYLMNYVDARNVRSVNWLARIGFTVHPAQPHGPYGMPFHKFEMGA